MSFWLYNINILFQNYQDFYPKNSMNNIDKANSIMRFSIYYSLLLILFKIDSSWLTISFLLIFLSIFIGITENFQTQENKCTKPTINNPYMNFTLGDNINNPQRPAACQLDDKTRNEQLKYFNKNSHKNNNDRNFYTMPSTTIVNDQTGFAKYLFGDFGKCKSEGKGCLKYSDNRFHKGRYYIK